MTRRLLALFAPGLLMAQTRNRCAELDLNNPVPPECTEGTKPIWKARIPRPRNGQCPVCGTMAYPYHEGSSSTQDAYYPWPGSRRLTICAHCNATFRQWAEGKEPK